MDMRVQILTILILLMAVVVNGHSPSRRNRTPYKPYGSGSYKYNLLRQTKLIKACEHKFLCQIKSKAGKCEPECIDKRQLCDHQTDCENGEDERACPEPTTASPCPEMQTTAPPCPEMQTTAPPCPECPTICNASQIRCSTNDSICATFCDGNAECPEDANGYVEDEYAVNCKCRIDESAPTKCTDSITPGLLEVLAATLHYAAGLCKYHPLCTGVFVGESFIELAEFNTEASVNCSEAKYKWYQCLP